MKNGEHTSEPDPDSKESLEKAGMQDEEVQEVHAQLMREKDEPSEGFSPVPIFLIFVFAALCFWGGVYTVQYSGDFRWDVYSPVHDPDAEAPEKEELTLVERGERVFSRQCAQCHQNDGEGVAGSFPPLNGSRWVEGGEERLARVLINGLRGEIEVKGNTYNGNMPAFGPNGTGLDAEEIAGVLTYIRQAWDNDAGEVTVDAMEDYMDATGDRSAQWEADELLEEFPLEE